MIENTINISGAAVLDIVGLYTGHSYEILLEQFEEDETTPKNFIGTYSMIICADADRKKVIMTFTESTGLIKSGNTLKVKETKSQNNFKAGIFYYHLINDVDSNDSYPEIIGKIEVKRSR